MEPGIPTPLRDAMRYSLLAPVSDCVPASYSWPAKPPGGKDDMAWPAACAVEMIHTYSLIHDDLPAMDDDDLRRGLPTCHKKFGEALAILAGDGTFDAGFSGVGTTWPADGRRCVLPGIGQRCRRGRHGRRPSRGSRLGTLDRPTQRSAVSPNQPAAHGRGAWNTFTCTRPGHCFVPVCDLGVLSGRGRNPNHDMLERLDQYGHHFGLVFQITDDLLDAVGTADATGKRTQKDAARGKLTYPGLLGVDESRRRARDFGENRWLYWPRLGEKGEPLTALMQFVLARNANTWRNRGGFFGYF